MGSPLQGYRSLREVLPTYRRFFSSDYWFTNQLVHTRSSAPGNPPRDVLSAPDVAAPKEEKEIAGSGKECLPVWQPLSNARDTRISEVEQPLGDIQVGSAEIDWNRGTAAPHLWANAETDTTPVAGHSKPSNKYVLRSSDENHSLQTTEFSHTIKDVSRFVDRSREDSSTEPDLDRHP